MKIKRIVVGLLGISVCVALAGAAKPPNVIYILADDLGYGDVGCYGQERIQTPRLDQMAAEGMRFTNHYAGSAVCAPSRCTLMTGLNQGHARIRGNSSDSLKDEDFTLAELMKAAGYRTAMIGKWGLGTEGTPGEPNVQGFDYYFGYLNQVHAHNHYPGWLIRNGEKVCLDNSNIFQRTPYGTHEIGSAATRKNEYAQALFTKETMQFIDESKDQPFFIYLASIIPHANNESGEILNQHGMEVPDEGIYANQDWPEAERCKAAMISYLDRDVGRILDYLKQKGLAENTLVIFSSDNGPHSEGGVDPEFFNSNGQYRGVKRDLYDGGIRVPMIALWPGTIPASAETDHLSAFWDVMPTLAELIGKPAPEQTDGISFLPTLLGKAGQKQHDYLYWEFHEQNGRVAIRKGKWKAVRYNVTSDPDSPLELYDIVASPNERINVVSRHPEVVAELNQLLKGARTVSPIDQFNFPLK